MQVQQSRSAVYYGGNHHEALSKYFPVKKEIKHRVLRDPIAIKISHLRANSTIFYFAAKPINEIEVKTQAKGKDKAHYVSRDIAYGSLNNSFVARVSPRGEVIIMLEKPQLYVDVDGFVHQQHFHFVYWENDTWSSKIHTHAI